MGWSFNFLIAMKATTKRTILDVYKRQGLASLGGRHSGRKFHIRQIGKRIIDAVGFGGQCCSGGDDDGVAAVPADPQGHILRLAQLGHDVRGHPGEVLGVGVDRIACAGLLNGLANLLPEVILLLRSTGARSARTAGGRLGIGEGDNKGAEVGDAQLDICLLYTSWQLMMNTSPEIQEIINEIQSQDTLEPRAVFSVGFPKQARCV